MGESHPNQGGVELERLRESLQAGAESIKGMVPPALSALASLSPDRRKKVFITFLEFVEPPSFDAMAEFAAQAKLRREEAIPIYSLLQVYLASAIANRIDPHLLLPEAARMGLVDAEMARTQLLDDFFALSGTFREKMLEYGLSTKLLPALEMMDFTIEARLDLKGSDLRRVTPVAILTLVTDIENKNLTFQVNPAQLSRLIAKLERIRDRLTVASELAEKMKRP